MILCSKKVPVSVSLINNRIIVLLVLLLCSILPGRALAEPAEMAPLADQSLLLDGQLIGDRVVVVGERGHILLSDDGGLTWQQQPVPTQTTLTSVFFINPRLGWAAGHAAIILRTTDGGESWTKVYEDPTGEQPILDLWFRDDRFGYAVGAYGLLLETTDGGDTWGKRSFSADSATPADPPAESEDSSWYDATAELGEDVHLNQLRESAGGRLYIAAEAGNVYRSDDGGATWLSLDPPYEGSFFGVLPLAGESLLVYGLRGNLLFSPDAGKSWSAIETGTTATLNDAIRLQDGRVVVVGLAGTLLISGDDGRTFDADLQPDRAGLSKVVDVGDGHVILIGTHGVRRLSLPASTTLPQVNREGRS